jgi:hypothetical protein
VLLATAIDGHRLVSHGSDERAALRQRLAAPGADAASLLEAAGLRWDHEALVPWSHWITPSVEPKRFSAHFFVAALPPGQAPQVDAVETVEQVWVRPGDAPARAAELSLPPPQLRTLWELRELRSIAAVMEEARRRAAAPHPILPRLAPTSTVEVPLGASPVPRTNAAAPGAGPKCLLLPWDRDYLTLGNGEAAELTPLPFWAVGPSRFVLEDRAWRHRDAPGLSTEA